MKLDEPNLLDLNHRIEKLESRLAQISHYYDEMMRAIPIKYKKAFPKDNENPFITTIPFNPTVHTIKELPDPLRFDEIYIPSDPVLRKDCVARMKKYFRIENKAGVVKRKYKKKPSGTEDN